MDQLSEVQVVEAQNYLLNRAILAVSLAQIVPAINAIKDATVLAQGMLTSDLIPSNVNASASITVSSGSLIASGGQTIIIDNQEAQTLSYDSGTGLLIVGPNQFGTAVTGNAGDTFVVPVAATAEQSTDEIISDTTVIISR